MGLLERLEGKTRIGIDTVVFIYHLEAHPVYTPLTVELFNAVEAGLLTAFTSTITLMEITSLPYRFGRIDVARKYEALLTNFPNLTIVPIDRDTARLAAQLRGRFRLRRTEALQAAAGLANGIQVLVTNDRQLDQLQPVCGVLMLEDLL
jgi:predicted nucleic acid-binding protein